MEEAAKADKNIKMAAEGEQREEENLRCGYFSWKPDCLQKCNTPPWLLASICWFTFVQSLILTGLNPVNLGTFERRFNLHSSDVAWIPASYDFCSAVLAIGFGYAAAYLHRGSLIAFGAYVMSLGSLVMLLPHILAGHYRLGTSVSDVCEVSGNSTQCDENIDNGLRNYLYVFIAGNMLHGFGGAAVYVVSPPYMDANVRTRNLAIYIGCTMGCSALGPAVGFIVGGLLLDIYVDAGRVNMDEVEIESGDPRWVGAWWIGYLCMAFASLTVGLLVCCFPRELPAAKIYRAEKKPEAHRGKGTEVLNESNRSWKATKQTLKTLFTNPVYVCGAIGSTVVTSAVAAFANFLPKIIQLQFLVTPTQAAIYSGLVVVPGAAGGQIFGGVLAKWLNLKVRGLLLQTALCLLVPLCFSPIFLIKCDLMDIAGVTVPYGNGTQKLGDPDLQHSCNANCSCTTRIHDPICGADGTEYFSPCHAGCLYKNEHDEAYNNCSCIMPGPNSTLAKVKDYPETEEGICPSDCPWMPVFFSLFFLVMFAAFMAGTSGNTAILRSMAEADRPLGWGIQQFLLRVLGAVPAPLILGAIFDRACLVWQENCDQKGSCWIYDTDFMATGMTIFLVVVAVLAVASFGLAAFLYKAPPDDGRVAAELIVDVKCADDEDARQAHNNVGYTSSNDCEANTSVSKESRVTKF